jgi:hypothetical protein
MARILAITLPPARPTVCPAEVLNDAALPGRTVAATHRPGKSNCQLSDATSLRHSTGETHGHWLMVFV